MKSSSGDGMLQYKLAFSNEAEPEERRMSDLSDWASSVTSSAEIQVIGGSEASEELWLKLDSQQTFTLNNKASHCGI